MWFGTTIGCQLLLLLATTAGAEASSCRYIPGDDGWPDDAEWAQLNETVGGRLIATVPQASVCHSLPYDDFNETACEILKTSWDYAQTLYAHSPSTLSLSPLHTPTP